MSLVRQPGRGSRGLLHFHLQELKCRTYLALWKGRPGSRRLGDGRLVSTRRPGLYGAERRARVHLQRGSLAYGELRDTGRNRLLLVNVIGRRRGSAVRLVKGQIRALLA